MLPRDEISDGDGSVMAQCASRNSAIGRRKAYIKLRPNPKQIALIIAGQKSPRAPQAKNGTKVITCRGYAIDELCMTPAGVGSEETK